MGLEQSAADRYNGGMKLAHRLLLLAAAVTIATAGWAGMKAKDAVVRDFEQDGHEAEHWFPATLPLLWVWSVDPNCPWGRRAYAVQTFYDCSPALARRWLSAQLEGNPPRSFVPPGDWRKLGVHRADDLRPYLRLALHHLRNEDLDAQFDGSFLQAVGEEAAFRPVLADELMHALQSADGPQARELSEKLHDRLYDVGLDGAAMQPFDDWHRRMVPPAGRGWEGLMESEDHLDAQPQAAQRCHRG